jgi:chemotaxis protein CheD
VRRNPERTGVVVGLGEAKVVVDRTAEEALVAYGLGSCVAMCLWDPDARVAGMAHVVLPGSDPSGEPNPRFARSALPALLALMREQGAAADPRRLVARLAGGAQVLALDAARGLWRVGDANARAVQEVLADAGVNVEGFDLGGSSGRSVWFDPRDEGQIRIRSAGNIERCF